MLTAALAPIALSGMVAAMTSVQAHGHNIANLGTKSFRRTETHSSSQAGGGVQTTQIQSDRPGHAPEEDLVGLLQAKHQFLANLAVFKTADAMAGALLDDLA